MNPKEILSALPSLNVLVIGDLILDHYIWGDVHRISPEAPVPVVHATHDTHTAGGAANVAFNLSSLAVKTSLIGSLGEDTNADILLAKLHTSGIDTTGCIRNPHAPTIVKTRVIARNQQLCRIDREASRASYRIELSDRNNELLETSISRADAVIVSDYAKGLITQELLDEVFTIANRHGKLLAVDPKPTRQLHFTGAGLITPNRNEALELAGLPQLAFGEDYPLAEVSRIIHQKYAPRILVITLGADGLAVCQNGEIVKILPTRAKEVFDVSGAGDTVIATLTAALAVGSDPLSAAAFANLAAGIVVSKIGTATPTITELLEDQ